LGAIKAKLSLQAYTPTTSHFFANWRSSPRLAASLRFRDALSADPLSQFVFDLRRIKPARGQ
jgi:hypothetical protein